MTSRDSQKVTDVASQKDTKLVGRRTPGLGRTWIWPEGDEDLKRIIFKRLPDLSEAVSHCRAKRVAIQAGAAMGVWAYALATEHKFTKVVAFEPNRALRPFLDTNLATTENVTVYSSGLSDENELCFTVTRPGNIGATWMKPAAEGDCFLTTLDGQIDRDAEVDLIQLDIEGHEYKALLGGQRLIRRCKPVCMIEETGLGTRYFNEPPNAAADLLKSWGYQHVATAHRDMIFVHPDHAKS